MSRREKAWYANWFNETYSHIYAHRDRLAANREAAFALTLLGGPPAGPVLDLCCGDGRHSHALVHAGCHVVGLDLSLPLLQIASETAKKERSLLRLVRGDMRHLPFPESFDAVFNFFTSFGYFEDDENQDVLREIARVLVPGGRFLLDYLNPEVVIRDLVPESERETPLGRLVERRRYDAERGRIEKDLFLHRGDAVERYHESVRAYSYEEMLSHLAVVGLCPEKVFGTLDGQPYEPTSPRMVLWGAACH